MNSRTGKLARKWRRLTSIVGAAAILMLCSGTGSLRAEQFLTVPEAKGICFPGADQFEERALRFSRNEAKRIQKRAGVKVRNKGNRTWLAWEQGKLAGVMVLDHVIGKHELIDYVVAISPEGEVLQVEVLEYREHYGGEIRDPNWRSQFKGKTSQSQLKLQDDISNISGATLSCKHVTEGIKRVLATYEVVGRPKLRAAGDLAQTGSASGR